MSGPGVSLDVTPLIGPATGVARFVAGVLPHLMADDAIRVRGWVLTARGGRVNAPADLEIDRIRLPARIVHRAWGAALPVGSRQLRRADVVHGTNFAVPPGPRSVLSVHDLTPLESSDLPASVGGRAHVIRRAVAEGSHVVVPTNHIRDRLVAAVGAEPSLVTTVPYGLDTIPPTEPGAGRRRAGTERYVLAIGTVNRRKNLVRLLDAVAGLPADIGIVIAGAAGNDEDNVADAIRRASAGRVVRRLPDVDDLARAELIRDADVLAYPSLDEGFGFPPLEAMSVGVPVVAATAGSIPEVVGDGAVLVDPTDTEAIGSALAHALEGDTRAGLVARGRAVAAAYDWARTAAGLREVYLQTADLPS